MYGPTESPQISSFGEAKCHKQTRQYPKFQENSTPAVINYNVPEPTSYAGTNIIALHYSGEEYVKTAAFAAPGEESDTLNRHSKKLVTLAADNAEFAQKV